MTMSASVDVCLLSRITSHCGCEWCLMWLFAGACVRGARAEPNERAEAPAAPVAASSVHRGVRGLLVPVAPVRVLDRSLACRLARAPSARRRHCSRSGRPALRLQPAADGQRHWRPLGGHWRRGGRHWRASQRAPAPAHVAWRRVRSQDAQSLCRKPTSEIMN